MAKLDENEIVLLSGTADGEIDEFKDAFKLFDKNFS